MNTHRPDPDALLAVAQKGESRQGRGKLKILLGMAANNFFRIGNLTARRELALRLTAEHVGHQLQD